MCVTCISPQALGKGCSGQPSPLLPGDLCFHRGGGEAAGSRTDPQSREAAGAHPGNEAVCVGALEHAHTAVVAKCEGFIGSIQLENIAVVILLLLSPVFSCLDDFYLQI